MQISKRLFLIIKSNNNFLKNDCSIRKNFHLTYYNLIRTWYKDCKRAFTPIDT